MWDNIKKRDLDADKSESVLAAAFGENIDYLIPKSTIPSPNTCAIIIANENYKRVPNVPFAHNDGNIFRKYFVT